MSEARITWVEEIDFEDPPRDGKPGDAQALRRIVGGQRALRLLYAALEGACGAEERFAVRLAARDFERRLAELLAAGETLLEGRGAAAKPAATLADEPVRRLAAAWAGYPADRLLAAASAFASRALACGQLVPWVSEDREVFEHFKRALEAEDAHLAVVEMLAGLAS